MCIKRPRPDTQSLKYNFKKACSFSDETLLQQLIFHPVFSCRCHSLPNTSNFVAVSSFCAPGAASKCEVCHWGDGGDGLERPGCHDPGPERHLPLWRGLHHHLRLRLAQQTACPHLRHQRQLLLLCWGCVCIHINTQPNWNIYFQIPNSSVVHTQSEPVYHSSHFMVHLQVEGPKQDLHSGVYGGTVIEPMTDLIGILGKCFCLRYSTKLIHWFIHLVSHSFIHSVTHRKIKQSLFKQLALCLYEVRPYENVSIN